MTEEAYLIIFYEHEEKDIRVRCAMFNITKPQVSKEAIPTNLDRIVSRNLLGHIKLSNLLRHEKSIMARMLLESEPPDRSEQDCTLLPVDKLQGIIDERDTLRTETTRLKKLIDALCDKEIK